VGRLGFDEWLVMAVVLALFFQSLGQSLWAYHGFPIPNPIYVFVGAVVIGRAAFLALRGRFDLSPPSWREWTVIGLFATYAVTALIAAVLGHSYQPKGEPLVLVSHLGQSIKTFAHFAYLGLMTLLLGRLLTPALLRRAFVTFFVLAVAAAVVACLQTLDQNALHTGATGALDLASRDTYQGFIRPCSVFSEPALLGYYMLIGAIVGLWLATTSRSRWIWVGIGLCVVATLLGAAAGPAVVFFVAFPYLMWRAWSLLRRSWRELAIIAAVAAVVLVFVPVGTVLSQRAAGTVNGVTGRSGSDGSAKFRLAFDRASVTEWKLSPLTGVGLGNTRYYNPSLVHLSYIPDNIQFQNVNTYLGTVSESGVFGLLMLATMMLALFLPLRSVRQEGAWVTEAPILLFIVACFFANLFSYPIFWFWVSARLAQVRHLEALELRESAQEYAGGSELRTA
jgi:O-antigen ligase